MNSPARDCGAKMKSSMLDYSQASVLPQGRAGHRPAALAVVAALALAATGASAAILFDAPGHAAVEGVHVSASGGEPGSAWALLDWRGRETGISGIFDAGGNAALPPLPAGYYRMVGDVATAPSSSRDGGLETASPLAARSESAPANGGADLATLAVIGGSAREPRRGSFYGVDCAADELYRNFDCPWNGGDAVRTVADLAALAGFTHVRGRHNWLRMQPSADKLDCSALVDNAALFRDRGIGVSGLIYGTPEWAGRIESLPADLAAVYRSCRDIGAAFGDTVEDWEFFNEPDIGFTSEPVWDYAAAMKAAYLGFKASAPQRPFLLGGLCQSVSGVYASGIFDNDGASYFDVFNYHTYEALSSYSPLADAIRAVLDKAGAAGRPIWFTECGTNHEGPAARQSVRKGFKAHSPEQEIVAAEFFPKSQIALQMAGVARNYAFILGAYSERDGAKDWGLLRRDGTVKPAYAALSTIAHELGDAALAGALDIGKGLRAYLFDHPDGTQTVAFWSESPIDTAASGQMVVRPEPDYAMTAELRVGDGPDGSHGRRFRLVDLCGAVSEIEAKPDGTLQLPATRFPAYLSGLRGLRADISTQRRRDAETGGLESASPMPESNGEAVSRPPSGSGGQEPASPIVLRVDLAPGDFEVSNNKTMAVAKGGAPRLRVQVWNLSDTTKAGRVEAEGATLEGLPEEPVEIAPFGKAEFDCALKIPARGGAQETADATATLVLRFRCDDGLLSSRLAMSVFFEDLFLASCEAVPLDWKDPAAWIRNDSAADYSVVWDEAEQAIRFDVSWKNPGVGRWFYPVLPLRPGGDVAGGERGDCPLAGAQRVTFEVKTAQDKMENDFGGRCYLMLVRGEKGGSPAEWLQYPSPIGTWERRYVELSTVKDLQEVDAIRLGANPRGMRLTFWVRGIAALKPKKRYDSPTANNMNPSMKSESTKPLRVALTFDDSLKDHALIAAPMLEERGWRGTFCIVSDRVGQGEKYMEWDDVRELVRRGHEIATHSKSHQNFVSLLEKGREEEVRREISESADRILSETGVAPRFVFTPYVSQNETTARIARELGIRQADVPRFNFGSNNCDRAAAVVDDLLQNGTVRADFLVHGVSAADHGGWCPFADRESFRRHLDTLARLEKEGKIVVTDYDGMASDCALKAPAWPHHGVLSLSFDDANFDQWEAALPIFAKYGASTTFFVVGTNRIDFAKKALAEGHEIGLHGLKHRDAPVAGTGLDDEAFWKADIAPQLAAFREAGVPVLSYAYPNCRRNERTDALFLSRGFARVRGLGAPFPPNPNPFDPKGEKLDKWRPVATADGFFLPAAEFPFARLVPNVIMGEAYHTDIEDTMRAIARAGERGEALFIVSHGIAPDAKGISMKTEWLERMLSGAGDLGVIVRGIR